MIRLKNAAWALLLILTVTSCASYTAFHRAQKAEQAKSWDEAVVEYEKALEIAPNNTQYKIALDRAKRESSRVHFEKGRTYRTAANNAPNGEQMRLAQLAATELQLVLKLDPTNQYAVDELQKALQIIDTVQRAAVEQVSVDEVKKRARSAVTKAQPPQLNPASDEPISLNFPREAPVKDIYRALANAFGINILFDQAVKDDRIVIELRDVTAQAALERVMQAANHFYKVLDEKTIIVVPDNPQARRDYEDLVIRTFYLSNGDAEQVTNVVRTMIEARNVFPLKALNAITIRDTADKVRIAEKIIEANDKAKAEVVVAVELVQLDLNKVRDIGFAVSGFTTSTGVSGSALAQPTVPGADGKPAAFAGGTLGEIAKALGSMNDIKGSLNFTLPQATYAFLKTVGNSELLANPELRISEGEKATLHIGQRIPVPVTTFQATVGGNTGGSNVQPYTSYQYQDVGIKVAMEPRVHHNREVTLKLTVEVSNLGPERGGQPTFATRTIESTIRLKDGETNFLAGLIQETRDDGATKTPFLGELPIIGRLFTRDHRSIGRTDLVLTMTPHIIRIPNITEDDLAPMWVGTTNNLTFRGVSPRIESQTGGDPFVPARNPNSGLPLSDGEPGNFIQPEGTQQPQQQPVVAPAPIGGTAPNDPFRRPPPPTPPPVDNNNPPDQRMNMSSQSKVTEESTPNVAAMRLAPRLAPQPSNIGLTPGETKLWQVIGMDLVGLTADELLLHYDPLAMAVTDISFGAALTIDPSKPPVATINRESGLIRVKSSDGKPLAFNGGGEVLVLRVHGGASGETWLVMESPNFRDENGKSVIAAVSGGKAKVQ
ncbi:MAG TPA: secretin N-terminal domain-containing protein [Thermoanaerobaculia bacterium]|jgi:general secretion pathway protein D